MYAVIFRAEINRFDDEYSQMASRLRERAMQEFGCLEFTACVENGQEIAISYWPDLASIEAWKNDSEHEQAQSLALSRWYGSYQVQVVELLRDYSSGGTC